MISHDGSHDSLQRIQNTRNNGTNVVVKGPWEHGYKSGEQAEAALPRFDTFILQLLVQCLHNARYLGVEQGQGTGGGEVWTLVQMVLELQIPSTFP